MSTRNFQFAVAAMLVSGGLIAGVPTDSLAAGNHSGGHSHGGDSAAAIGEPGKVGPGTRTVQVVLEDNRFEPENIKVKAGETVRFVLRNKGEFLHEFNIGTATMHAEHQKEMAMMVEHGMLTPTGVNQDMMKMDHSKMGTGHSMKHDDPNSVLVEPGKTKELVWKFPADAQLEFACNLPGHYESGMVGKVQIGR